MRGKGALDKLVVNALRITPAYAGKYRRSQHRNHLWQDYTRTCGYIKFYFRHPFLILEALHPCSEIKNFFLAFDEGLRYSNARRYFLDIFNDVQHRPRKLCGSIFFFVFISEITPHIWEKCIVPEVQHAFCGITPAGAGKGLQIVVSCQNSEIPPRMGKPLKTAAFLNSGSPPHRLEKNARPPRL